MTDPQRAPVSALFDHLANAVNDIQNTQACLQGVYGLVKVSCSLLCLEQVPLLVHEAPAYLGYAFVK